MSRNFVQDALFGLSIGDALGVPVEFSGREQLKLNPVEGMRGYESWNQPPGTWSDDSSLSFCLADSLAAGYDLNDIGTKFVQWYDQGYWAAYYEVFDVGNTTANAILRLKDGTSPKLSGDFDEFSNGNGSLMRILPLIFYTIHQPIEERFRVVKEVSSITHMHFRSVFSCFIYLEFAKGLLMGFNKEEAYELMQREVEKFVEKNSFNEKEVNLFYRVLYHNIAELEEHEISSSGYVIHSLEAAIWCLLTSGSFSETVLKAVNLGGDTDTTATIAGGLAGILHGASTIPQEWLKVLARKADIAELAKRLNNSPIS
jgi:ADP-ribosyl-[dinitrogen reductase] hydrolase